MLKDNRQKQLENCKFYSVYIRIYPREYSDLCNQLLSVVGNDSEFEKVKKRLEVCRKKYQKMHIDRIKSKPFLSR